MKVDTEETDNQDLEPIREEIKYDFTTLKSADCSDQSILNSL